MTPQTCSVSSYGKDSLRRAEQGGHWAGKESLHYVERRLLNASSLSSELRTLGNLRSDDAMVDVLGMCLYASPLEILDAVMCLCYHPKGYYIHIGVGFEVAYLSEKASSKARNTR